MTKIGANIKKIRTAKGLSQQSFADLFELTRGNISSYEENRAEPRLETCMRIANHFSIPLEAFIIRVLTVNEILKFNGDKLIEDESHIINLQLRQVPFINESIFMKCSYREMRFTDFAAFPQLVLPETTTNALLALTYHSNIPHHQSLEGVQGQDILVFEELTRQNVHLSANKTGLFTSDTEIMLGRFESTNQQTNLVLNEFTQKAYDFTTEKKFWKQFAIYKHG